MSLIGLTGGIGMGKTSIAAMLRSQDVAVIDTDDIARELTRVNGEALPSIRAEFGSAVFTDRGELDRAAMAKKVFGDSSSRVKLERILHPMIRQRWMEWASLYRQADQATGVVVIPLLFETQMVEEFDCVICVSCRAIDQKARLRQRGWSDAEIVARNAAQWSIEQKIEQSDIVFWTSCTKECTMRQVEATGLFR